jgi:hypothetical protein
MFPFIPISLCGIILGSWIRIRIKVKKAGSGSIVDPHKSEKVEALKGHFGALDGRNLEKSEW